MDNRFAVVLTRVETLNAGNEALSCEVINFVKSSFPELKLHVEERISHGYAHIGFNMLSKQQSVEDAVAYFDNVATKITEKYRNSPYALTEHVNPIEKKITLVAKGNAPSLKSKIKQKLQLRSYLSRFSYYDDAVFARLQMMTKAEFCIMNAGGEWQDHSSNSALKMLVELLAAHKLGAKVGIVNFSFEITNQFESSILAAILNKLDYVSVRDTISNKVLVDCGFNHRNASVTPDLAFCAQVDMTGVTKQQNSPPRIAVVVRTHENETSVSDWEKLVTQLTAFGSVTIISNEVGTDKEVMDKLAAISGVSAYNEFLSYKDYCRKLTEFDCIVSARLHSGVLGMIAQVPVVLIEPFEWRIIGLFADVGYELKAVPLKSPTWIEDVLGNTEKVLSNASYYQQQVVACSETARKSIYDSLSRLIRNS